MRICIKKSTGKLIESQSGGNDIPELMEARLNTLKQNAINAGHLEADIEVRFVTDEEYAIAIAEDPNEIARIAEQEAKEAAQIIKAQAYIDNLPSWSQIKKNINNITDLAGAKAFLLKLARVVYWDIKNTEL
jgi:hypothetical protein